MENSIVFQAWNGKDTFIRFYFWNTQSYGLQSLGGDELGG